MFRTLAIAGALSTTLTSAAMAGGIEVHDAYARSASPAAKTGAAFMVLINSGPSGDRLVGVSSPVAERTELHTHIEDANGIMRMVEVEDGFALPAGGRAVLQRGGDHVMLMGLNEPLTQGDMFPLTLVFEQAGEVVVDVTVDLERQPGWHGGNGGGHGQDGNHMGH